MLGTLAAKLREWSKFKKKGIRTDTWLPGAPADMPKVPSDSPHHV